MKNKKIGVAIICSCLMLGVLALSGCPAFDFNQIIDTPTTTTTSPPTQDTSPPLPQITSDSVQLAYEDDFSNTDSGWRQSSDAEVSYSYQNGEYNISVSTAGFTYSASNNSVGEQDNFVVEVDARVLSSAATSEYGILFRRNDNNDFYGFRITGNQYTVDKYFQSVWSYLQPATASNYIKTDGSTNTLMVACLGTTIEVYVNGQRLATLNDDSLTSGKISLSASEASTSVSFDNFRLYQFTNSYIAVAAPYLPIITTSSLPDGEVGIKYYEVLTASGGDPPYFWELTLGDLPEGLSLDSATGIITGAPAMEGEYDFSIKLITGSGETAQELSIYISELVITTDSLATGIMNVPYNQVLQASGGEPPYTWSIVSGSLPNGLVLDAASGAITGISSEYGGPFTSVFQVVDRAGATAAEGLSLTVKLGDFAAIDQYADDTPSSVETSIGTLVNYLIQPCNTDMEKARVIYRWIAQNIDYDVYTFVSGLYETPNCPDQSAEAVFARRDAICAGYSNLFLQMCGNAGLQAVQVIGWGRIDYTEEGYTKDHAWNAVQINGAWQLLDSTWGAGYMEEESYFVRSFDDFWFLTPPEQFIYTHYPEEASWQLLNPTVPVAEVAYFPVVTSDYFTYGLQLGIYNQGIYTVTNMGASINIQVPPDALLIASLFQNDTEIEDSLVFYQRQENTYRIDALFPYAGDYELRIYAKWQAESEYHHALKYKLIAEQSINYQAGFPTTFDLFNTKGAYLYSPMTGSLPARTLQYFEIMVPGAKEVDVILDAGSPSQVFQPLSKQGQIFQGSFNITSGKTGLVARFTNDNQFSWLVEYKGE